MSKSATIPKSDTSNCGCAPSQSIADDVDEAALESFPASDPPAFTAGTPAKKQAPPIVVPPPAEIQAAPPLQPK